MRIFFFFEKIFFFKLRNGELFMLIYIYVTKLLIWKIDDQHVSYYIYKRASRSTKAQFDIEQLFCHYLTTFNETIS